MLDILSEHCAWLSPISFNVNAPWFGTIRKNITDNNKVTETFISKYHHRWKQKIFKCDHCGDGLVEDGVVHMTCSHTLCKECCKAFLSRSERWNREGDLAGGSRFPDIARKMVICNICHTPSTVLRSVTEIGITCLEVIKILPFIYSVEVVWQHQRRRATGDFRKSNLGGALDYAPYTRDDSHGAAIKDPNSLPLPGPEWYWAEQWHPVVSSLTDASGWSYAYSMRITSWKPAPSTLRFMRRRKLVRLRINGPGTRFIRNQLAKEIFKRYGSDPGSPCSPNTPDFLRTISAEK